MSVAFRMLVAVVTASVLQVFSGHLSYAQTPQSSFKVFPAPHLPGASQASQFSVQIQQDGVPPQTSPVYVTQKPSEAPTPPFESTTAWTSFAADGPVMVQVTNTKVFYSARILPSHAQIVATLPPQPNPTGGYNVVIFTMNGAGPQQVSVEFCYTPTASSCDETTEILSDISNPLLVFANPMSATVPQNFPQGPVLQPEPGRPVSPLGTEYAVVYFGPGVYDLGAAPYVLGSKQAAFLAGGAYVTGTFLIEGGAKIEGLGVLSGLGACTNSDRTKCPIMIDGSNVAGSVTISGITIVDSPFYNIKLNGTGNAVSNIKVISWLANTDGITPGSGTLSDSFFKTGDDAIKLYSSDLTVSGCTLWHLGNAAPFEMGVNLNSQESPKKVLVENCDVIRTEWVYPDRSNAVISAAFGGNADGNGYTFRNIRVENTNPPGFSSVGLVFQLFKLAVIPNGYTSDNNNSLGSISNVTFSNIQVTDCPTLPNLFQSFDTQHMVNGISFENVTVAGRQKLPSLTFNANRNFSLSGTVFSNILWRNSIMPTEFRVAAFNAASEQPTISWMLNDPFTSDYSVQGIGDFGGDGNASVLFLNSTNGKLYLWGKLLSSQSTIGSIPGNVSPGVQVAGIGDFNGDGQSDILLWDAKGQVGSALLMNGTRIRQTLSVVSPPPPTSSSVWSVAGIGDIDQSGQADIILRDSQTGDIAFLSLQPDGTFNGPQPLHGADFTYPCSSSGGSSPVPTYCPLDQSWNVAGVGDLRGNGYASILWVNQETRQIVVTGFAFAAQPAAPPAKPFGTVLGRMPPGYQIASLGDFNGDGTMDILLYNSEMLGWQTIWYTGYYDGALYKQGPWLPPFFDFKPQPFQAGPTLPPLSGNFPAQK